MGTSTGDSGPHRAGLDGTPSVAVIIPCWNAERWIGQAIQSALDQDYRNLEVIVIDDGSTDKSLSIIKSFEPRVRWASGPNKGACAARNAGVALSRSDFVLFLDSDDFLCGPYVRNLCAEILDDTDVVVGGYANTYQDGRIDPPIFYDDTAATDIVGAYLDFTLQTSCFLWRKALIERAGGWNEKLAGYQDTEFALRCFLPGPRCRIVSRRDAFAVYRHHDAEHRISNSLNGKHYETILQTLDELVPHLQRMRRPEDRHGLAMLYYNLSKRTYVYGYPDVGQLALARARTLGLTGHPGSIIHRIASSLFGLRAKMELVAFIKRTVRILRALLSASSPHEARSRQ